MKIQEHILIHQKMNPSDSHISSTVLQYVVQLLRLSEQLIIMVYGGSVVHF